MSNLARPPVITSDVEDLCDVMARQIASRYHSVSSWYKVTGMCIFYNGVGISLTALSRETIFNY